MVLSFGYAQLPQWYLIMNLMVCLVVLQYGGVMNDLVVRVMKPVVFGYDPGV